jgi:ribonuclease HII
MPTHAEESAGGGAAGEPGKSAPPRGARRGGKVQRWSGIERAVREEFGPLVAGVDEVGRGPLAGPVVACAVIMPPDARAIRGVDDSKQLPRAERERLAALIRARAIAVGLGAASAREIDRLNIYHATVLAMRRALGRLAVRPHHVVVDGLPLRALGVPHRAVVGGDARCYSVACASIVAKVTRDRVMRALGLRHPEYRWTHNVGYATAAHLAGIDQHGISAHHRRRFWRVAQTMLDLGVVAADVEVNAVFLGDEAAPHRSDAIEMEMDIAAGEGASIDPDAVLMSELSVRVGHSPSGAQRRD